MDSINQQQQEENHLDLDGGEAGQKIKALCEKTKTCFFCTSAAMESRPMSVQKVDEDGTLWFLSASDSKKNAEITSDPEVQLFFQGSAYSDFLALHGRAIISRDKEKIKELWEPILKTWFTEGIEDQRITVLEVRPDHGYYWDTKHGKAVAFAKQIAGAIMGKTMDDSIEGRLQVRL
jgi:general stress protein 26